METDDIFSGVRVVELAQYVFVPGAGALLADFGAEVIKVESVGTGDPYRTMSIGDGREKAEVNIALEQNNRGKKSIGLDVKTPKGREILKKLIESADVFATSIRPHVITRLRLDVDDVREWNPKIIYVRGNGLGFNGPEAGKPGFDATSFWMRSGFSTVLMHSDHTRPLRSRGAFGDHTSSISAAYGIAAALFKRERSGKPSVVDVSLLSSGMWVLSADITAAQIPGYDSLLSERRAPINPLGQVYKTRDGRWIQLTFLNPDQYWGPFCKAIGLDEYANDSRFMTIAERAKNGIECGRLIAEKFASKAWPEWKPILEKLDAPWELARTIHEMLDDPQAVANGYIVETNMANGADIKLVSGPVIFNQRIPKKYQRAPKLGEHTEELLTSLGLSEQEIVDLMSDGVVK